MKKHNTRGPASQSTTLRDYFAAKAMPMAFQYFREDADFENNKFAPDPDFYFDESVLEVIATTAYAMADAMIRVRQRPTTTE